MRRLVVGLVLASGAACLDFDARVDAGCELGASWAECDAGTGGGAQGGGGGTGGGWTDAGEVDAGEVDAGEADAGEADAGEADAGEADAGPTDGGGLDGGADAGAPDAGFRGCFGHDAWCWEHPSPFGAPDLFAVWGTSDSDVWVAGSGGVVMRWDGTEWTWHGERLGLPAPSGAIDEAVVRAVARDDAGVVWLVGEQMPIVGLRPNGTSFTARANGYRFAASSAQGYTAFASPGSTTIGVEWVTVGSTTPVPVSIPLPDGDNATAFINANGELLVAYETQQGARIYSELGGASPVLDGGPGRSCQRPRAFALARGVPVLTCEDGHSWSRTDAGTWLPRPTLSLPGVVQTHQFEELGDGGLRWWLSGAGAFVATQEGNAQPQVLLGPDYTSGWGSWLSPQGSLWVVGTAGHVARVRSETDKARLGANASFVLSDLAVSESRALAVGQFGEELERDPASGKWVGRKDSQARDLTAVALRPDGGVCRLFRSGELECEGLAPYLFQNTNPDGGDTVAWYRAGAVAFDEQGFGVAAMGNRAALLYPDAGSWSDPGGWLWGSHTADVLVEADRFAVLTNEALADGTPTRGVLTMFEPGVPGQWCMAPPGKALFGAARLDGGYLVVGDHVAGRCAFDGGFSDITVPSSVWTSAWVDHRGTWWILDQGGIVLSRPAGGATWNRERLPAGGSALDGPLTVRIRGNSREVFVIGARERILRRPLP